MDTLNKQAEAIRLESPEADNERFSEYLWKLEHNNEISPEERESYIGIYRLMNQVEKTDGAAIGALIAQGGELTMRNLLTAVRSSKKSGMDYTVDDEFSGVDGTVGKSITDQIETAYQSDCMRDVLETLTPVKMQKLMESPGLHSGAVKTGPNADVSGDGGRGGKSRSGVLQSPGTGSAPGRSNGGAGLQPFI